MNYRKVLYYYWIQAKKYPKSGIVVFAAYSIAVFLNNTISPILYKNIIDTVSIDGFALSMVTSWVYILGALLFLSNLLFRLADYSAAYFESNIFKELSNYVFQKIHRHSYSFFADNFSGAIVSKAKRFVGSFVVIFESILWHFVVNSIQIIGSIVVLFLTSSLLGSLYAGWITLFLLVSILLTRKKIPYDLAEANMDSKAIARFADAVTNALTIKIFSSYHREKKNFGNFADKWEKKRRAAWNMNNLQLAVQGTMIVVLEFVIMYVAVRLLHNGAITIGTLVLVQMYVIGTFDAVWSFGRALSSIEKSLSDAKEMVDIFEEKPSVLDSQHPEVCRIGEGNIRFCDVTFYYEKDGGKVFENFDFAVASGEKVGLVGHSGAGKTTITKLLLRFADIHSGVITIDGQNIASITQDDLRRQISYVPQDPLLFHRSLRENIAYGKPNATEEEILETAKKAHAHDFISKLPKGYNTLVGERGVKLSGGERQRVAIARAILKNAPILILDEATSSLDSLSERKIQEALGELMKGRTTIVVAHRLSTIQKMDRIVVMEEGKIIEEGSHTNLLAKSGIYASFWKQQVGGFLGE